MIKLSKVELRNGTIYYNLYYNQTWEDLELLSESNVPTILFYLKKKGRFEELELETETITNIMLDKDNDENRYGVFYDPEYNRLVLANDEFGEDYDGRAFHPKLEEINYFLEDLFSQILNDYSELDDQTQSMILDNMIAIVLGYLEAAYDLDDEKTSMDDIFTKGYIISILASSFICETLESEEGYKQLLKDTTQLVPIFSKYIEENQAKIKIVNVNPDKDTQK